MKQKRKKRKNRIVGVILLLLLLITQVTPVMAGGNSGAPRIVRVSCGINKALYLNDKGEPEGYCSEYLQQLAKINNWKLDYVEASWSDSVQNLYDGKIDLLFPTQMTEERKEKMGFFNAIGGYQPIGLFAKTDSDYCFDDYSGFDGARVALSAGTSNEAALEKYAQENGFSFIPVYMNTTDEKMQALEDGTVDMIVFSTLNDVAGGKVVAMLDYLPFYYCTSIENTELLNELDYGMNQMLLRNPTLVQEVFYDFMNRNISFAYTAEEQAEILSKDKITVGIYENTPPLFSVNEDGSFTGIYVDLIRRIEELSGLNMEIQVLNRKDNAFAALEDKKVDFVLGSSDQALKYSQEKGYAQSEGIMDYYTIAISRPDYIPEKDSERTYALTKGRRYWENEILKDNPYAQIQYYQTSKECLEAVAKGKADFTLLNTWEYNYHSKNERFSNLMEWETSRVLSETVFVSLESENEKIRSVLDKSIEQIPNAEKESIITQNLNVPYRDYSLMDRLYSAKEGILLVLVVFLFLLLGFVFYVEMKHKNMHTLEVANRELQEANAAKDRFLSRMSHELRTPLNAIDGYTSVVEQNLGELPAEKSSLEQNLESIHRAVKYQLAIIGDLLNIQKIESGKMELQITEVDFAEYMKEMVGMIRPEADAKHISFSYDKINKINETYLMDGVRFQQVLLNILHNAIKFTPAGGNVTMTAEVIDRGEKANTLKFVITDDGIGMSEDFQKNYLFKRFAQEYSDTTSPYEGCGTGLAISYDIMHLMGGSITCHSIKGEGSTFTVILTVEHTGKRHRRTQTNYGQYDLSGIRVLLCEDNKMNQDMECRILEKMKCQVDIADDGVIGLEKFQNSTEYYYSIVLMDIRMPNMDGWECTRAIRGLDRADAGKVPIVAVSANAFEEDIQQSMDAGMNEHLAKPVDLKLLYEKIREYCQL